jgi:hypothetical protein
VAYRCQHDNEPSYFLKCVGISCYTEGFCTIDFVSFYAAVFLRSWFINTNSARSGASSWPPYVSEICILLFIKWVWDLQISTRTSSCMKWARTETGVGGLANYILKTVCLQWWSSFLSEAIILLLYYYNNIVIILYYILLCVILLVCNFIEDIPLCLYINNNYSVLFIQPRIFNTIQMCVCQSQRTIIRLV